VAPEFRAEIQGEPDLKVKILRTFQRLCRRESERTAVDVATIFLRWTFMRAVFHRGYVLVAFLYFVVDAHLSASELIFLGTAMSVTLSLSDVPAGAFADTIGRRWSLVLGHVLLSSGMMMTAFVTAYPLIIATQVLWGLGWAFSGGADVAWLTDELDHDNRIDRVLAAGARLALVGAVVGMGAFGLLGRTSSLATAIAVSGAGMGFLGIFVAAQFSERTFVSRCERRWTASLLTLRRGLAHAFGDKEVLLVFGATTISEGASIVGWLFPKQLVNLGVANESVLWWTVIGILSFAAGAVALRVVETRIDDVGTARRSYVFACLVGAIALVMLAYSPNVVMGCVGMLLAWGVAFNVTRVVCVIWVNRRVASDVRATVLSCLSQARSFGGILGGFALTILAKEYDIRLTLAAAGALLAIAAAMVASSSADRGKASARNIREGF
jgi:MFS transporter, DHA3 family, tetracycline resistance protein